MQVMFQEKGSSPVGGTGIRLNLKSSLSDGATYVAVGLTLKRSALVADQHRP